jgi:tRNA threonylcarbamoyladenosine biosynthesis protein TsaE
MKIEGLTSSEEATHALGAAIGRALRPGDFLALNGELGAGKTRLVRGIAAGLGIDPNTVNSPTFVIVNEYPLDETSRRPDQPALLVHVDAYRLRGPDDLDTIGWDHITAAGPRGSDAAIVVEWASRIAPALPNGARQLNIQIEHVPGEPDSRRFTIEGDDAWSQRAQWQGVEQAISPDTAPGVRAEPGSLPDGWTRCPVTGKPVSPDSPTFPFFDEKAKLADLGRWFTGSYHVSRELMEEDMDDPDLVG